MLVIFIPHKNGSLSHHGTSRSWSRAGSQHLLPIETVEWTQFDFNFFLHCSCFLVTLAINYCLWGNAKAYQSFPKQSIKEKAMLLKEIHRGGSSWLNTDDSLVPAVVKFLTQSTRTLLGKQCTAPLWKELSRGHMGEGVKSALQFLFWNHSGSLPRLCQRGVQTDCKFAFGGQDFIPWPVTFNSNPKSSSLQIEKSYTATSSP